MRFFRFLAVLVVLAAIATGLAASASAATTRTYQLYGAQKYYAGSYFGAAWNSAEKGYWYAQLNSGALVGSDPVSIQAGGDLELTILKGRTTELTFTGGTLVPQAPVSECATQTYAVDAGLSGEDGSTGTFTGTLTAYRFAYYGRCFVITSTIFGALTLTS